eukprot:Hpha_TRINITY_DN14776_c0_g1::TRINITY_DN14776_c0_g1_i1::g.102544::m.102544
MGNCGGGGDKAQPPQKRRPSSSSFTGTQRPPANATGANSSTRPSTGPARGSQRQPPAGKGKAGGDDEASPPASPEREGNKNREVQRHEQLRGTHEERQELLRRDQDHEADFKKKLGLDYTPYGKDEEELEIERVVVVLQRKWKILRVQRRFRGLVFRLVWRELEAYDERIVSQVGEKAAIASSEPSPRGKKSGTIRQDELDASSSQSGLHYPDGFISLDRDARKKHVETLISALKRQELIPENYVWGVLDDARILLQQRSNVQKVSLLDERGGDVKAPHANRVIVVGDLHGHLDDLMHIIDKGFYRLPEVSNKYVFNGDFVDRGDNSVEVIVLLLSLVLAFPDSVFLNRGNHEGRGCSQMYGFYHELLTKYDNRDLFEAFVDLFNAMPLCTLIENEVLVVHGGPPRPDAKGEQITLGHIDGIKRFCDIPCVRKDNINEFTRDEIILADLLWSDPKPDPEKTNDAPWAFNNVRSNGIFYRPAHSAAFCKKNKLGAIIRSHESIDSGFVRNPNHGGRVVTVFSASNYCGLEGNDAAVAVLTRSEGKGSSKVNIAFHTWCMHADAPTVSGSTGGTGRDVVRRLTNTVLYTQDEVLRLVSELIHRQRHELASAFSERDIGQTGTVAPAVWAEVMGGTLQVPWYSLRRYLVETDASGRIAWMSRFLYRFHCRLEDKLMERWAPYLLQWVLSRSEYIASQSNNAQGGSPEDLYDREVEKAGKKVGGMSYKSFFHVIKDELNTTLPKEVIYALFVFIDKWRSGKPPVGKITRQHWLEACADAKRRGLCVHERQQTEGQDAKVTSDFHLWDWWLLQRFRDMFRGLPDTISAYRLFDHDRDTHIGVEDLRRGIANLNLSISQLPGFRKQAKLWAGGADKPQEVAELFGAPSEVGAIQGSKAQGASGRRGSGQPRPAVITTWPLQESQLKAFLSLLDNDHDGKVSFRDFVFSFYVRDREHDETLKKQTGHEPTIWHELNDDIWGAWNREASVPQLRSTRSMRQKK